MSGSRPRAVVRRADPADAEALARLLDAFNREFWEPSPGVAVLARRLSTMLASPAAVALAVGDPAVGVALLSFRDAVWSDGPTALLEELYVVPERRNGGLGGALLEAAEAAARDRGAELLEINVDGEDADARRFYERHGYVTGNPGQQEPQFYYSRELGRQPSGSEARH